MEDAHLRSRPDHHHAERSLDFTPGVTYRDPGRLNGNTLMPHGSVTDHATVELKVLRCFELRVDHVVVSVPTNVERLLAYLAVQDCPQPRHHVAGHLSMSIDARAAASLRTALSACQADHRRSPDHQRRHALPVPCAPGRRSAAADSAGAEPASSGERTRRARRRSNIDARRSTPDWDEEWIVGERERLRQLACMHSKHCAPRAVWAGGPREAVDVAMMAISAEPLQRERSPAPRGSTRRRATCRSPTPVRPVLQPAVGRSRHRAALGGIGVPGEERRTDPPAPP